MTLVPTPAIDWNEATDSLLAPLLTASRLGLVTDVDGTISPIVNQPEAAQVTPRSRELLAALADKLALVGVISGRAVADVQARVGISTLVYVGNHGLERWANGRVEVTPEAQKYRPALEAVAEGVRDHLLPGMQIEDKGATYSIHYRNVADPGHAEAELTPLLQRLTTQHAIRLFQGRMIFELRPPLDIDKGTAFDALVRDYRLDAAIYLGDDTTDADALRACKRLRAAKTCYAIGLGVVADETPAAVIESADVLAHGIPQVEAFLNWLNFQREN
ncbi:MAG: trehalose-phosphatase [Anaerolineae bacterium]|nr:trehalose-phosphatase [Anaerolineae bacterium]MCA9908659.1 trehalose-phosphatase [Anaerolineae bacterium]